MMSARAPALFLATAAAAVVGRVAGVRLATGASRFELDRRGPEGQCAVSYDSLLPGAQRHGSIELVAADHVSRPVDSMDTYLAAHEAEYMYNLSHHRQCKTMRDKIGNLQPLVIPELKLAFCYVPKVACSQFKDMFNWINKKPNNTLGFGRGYVASMPRKMNISLKEMTRENGWKFATFTRDPVLRYISAFGSTCVSNKTGGFEHKFACCGPTAFSNVSIPKMAEFLKARVMSDVEQGTVDKEDHWVQQVEILKNCGWDNFKPSTLDYWGLLTGDVNKQVKEMLSVVGYKNDTAVDWFFPKGKKAGHTNPMRGEPHDYIQDVETLQGIMKLYEDDFKDLAGVGCSFTEPLLARFEAASEGANASVNFSAARRILVQPGESFRDGRTRR